MTPVQGINWKVHDKGGNKRQRQYSSIEQRLRNLVYCEEEDTEKGFRTDFCHLSSYKGAVILEVKKVKH